MHSTHRSLSAFHVKRLRAEGRSVIPTSGPEAPGVVFHLLSFEGPDPYARAGGIASRITGLAEALAAAGLETHLWFVGDPALPGDESRDLLRLHRWCQWISEYHPGGVYDGEEGKEKDFAASLPPFLLRHHLRPHLRSPGHYAVVLAEEWHTVGAVLRLHDLLTQVGLRDRTAILWNANNVFGFERIDWPRLANAATITTVSRYMRQRMWPLGVDALIFPNGLREEMLRPPEHAEVAAFRQRVGNRLVLAKVARWDPDKRWLLAVDTVASLKERGHRPLLIARGGVEAHGAEVLGRATALGLRVTQRFNAPGARGLLEGLAGVSDLDLLSLRSPLSWEASRLLFRSAAAVLANSGHEPFGLVGLETMAARGVACVGGTGEDYAVPGHNALLLQTENPQEFLSLLRHLMLDRGWARALRRRAHATARWYTWPEIIGRDLLPRLEAILGLEGVIDLPRTQACPPARSRSWTRGRPAGTERRVGSTGVSP